MRLRPRCAALLILVAPCIAWGGDRIELLGELDLRAVWSDASPSFLEGGLGRQRFDPDTDGAALGRAFGALRYRVTDTVTANLVAGSWGDADEAPVDVTEAYVDYRPFPQGPWRWRVRGGMFYAPTSFENRGPGWSNVYTVSNSVVSTWIAEEIRTIGLEGEARWRGSAVGSAEEFAFTAGVFGWNDPAGVLVASRGFALHDRQTTLFGRYPYPGSLYEGPAPKIDMFREIDDRAGYYVGAGWRHASWLDLRVMHYDNRGDPGASDSSGTFAWDTRFDLVGLRVEPDEHWTIVAQALLGRTSVGGHGAPFGTQLWDINAWFGLVSYAWGPNRLSARYDQFSTRQQKGDEIPYYDDTGSATALTYLREFGEHWQVGIEWLRIRSTFEEREEFDLSPTLDENQVQALVRYSFKVRD
ncbi:MAG: hypothetical protein U1F08_02375 [Steroidobacteraceae bacterium]